MSTGGAYARHRNLFAASGILIAVLSLWAQLWYRYADHGRDGRDEAILRSASLGLFWIYMAILIALLAFGLTALKVLFGWHSLEIAAGFGIASFLMGLLNIGESTISLFIKVGRGKTAFGAMFEATKETVIRWRSLMAVFAAFLCAFSMLGMVYHHAWFFGDLALIVVVIAGYFLRGISNSSTTSKNAK